MTRRELIGTIIRGSLIASLTDVSVIFERGMVMAQESEKRSASSSQLAPAYKGENQVRRARQAGLLFQHNPRFSFEIESATVGGSDTSVEVNLLQELEIATAMANQNVSRAELEGRMLAVKQEVDSAYKKMDLAKENLAGYGKAYLGEIEKNLALTRKAYESGEMTIFEFSAMRDRLTQSRFRFMDVAVGYLQTVAELEAQAPSCFDAKRANQSVP
jgi:outer membrane protein TolC